MNRYNFMSIVDEAFNECETEEQKDKRFQAMKEVIEQSYMHAKNDSSM